MSSFPTLGLRDYAARYGMILDEAYALMEHLRASNPQLPQHAPPDLPPTLEGISVYLGVSRGSEVSGLQPWQLEEAFLSVHAVIGFPLALAYLCAVVFFYARGGRFRWLEAAGRMALSNYLAQSLCFTAVLYPYGLNLTEWFTPTRVLGYSLVFFAAQSVLSYLWLSRFRMGPMEWLWRTLTYGKVQPFRLETTRDFELGHSGERPFDSAKRP